METFVMVECLIIFISLIYFRYSTHPYDLYERWPDGNRGSGTPPPWHQHIEKIRYFVFQII